MIFRERVISNFFKYKRKAEQRHFVNESSMKYLLKLPKILFFGTDDFSLPSLIKLHQNCCSTSEIGIVTSFKNPANCVRLYAEKHKIPLFRWPVCEESSKDYELGVVVSFGNMIPTSIINSFPLGMINVHASLLSRWRGAAPIIYSLLHGDAEAGVSIMKIEPKHFDIGDVLAQRSVPIKENCFLPELHERLAHEGAELLLEVVKDYHVKSKNAKPQIESMATYAPKVSRALTEVNDWPTINAEQLYRRYRALYGFKHLTTKFDGRNVQLIEIKLSNIADSKFDIENCKTPGAFVYLKERRCILVRCASDSFIEIHKLRVEGRKVMSAMEFSNGFLKSSKVTETCFAANKSR